MSQLLEKILVLLVAVAILAACGSNAADEPDETTGEDVEVPASDSAFDEEDPDKEDEGKEPEEMAEPEEGAGPEELEAGPGNQIIATDEFAFEAPEELSVLEDSEDIDRLASLGAGVVGELPGGLSQETLSAQLSQVDLLAIDEETGANMYVATERVGSVETDEFLEIIAGSPGFSGVENFKTSTGKWDGGEIAIATYELPVAESVQYGKTLAYLDGEKVYQVSSTSVDTAKTEELADLVEESFQLR